MSTFMEHIHREPSIYDHVGDGTYESVTWQYDEGTYVTHPTTQSVKPAGTVKVGDTLPDAPHMTAITVTAF